MIETHYRTRERRVLGWYAVRWMYVNDWIRKHLYRWPVSTATRTTPTARTIVNKDQGDEQAGPTQDSIVDQKKKLESIVKESYGVLAKAQTVFPLTLFRDAISIDRHKLTIIYRSFFGVEQTVSIPIADIKNIQADHGPFFGSLTISSDNFVNNTQTIRYLWNSDAIKIQKLVEGIQVAIKEDVDLSAIDTKELRKLLTKLGERHK
jgi:hypothetical protein